MSYAVTWRYFSKRFTFITSSRKSCFRYQLLVAVPGHLGRKVPVAGEDMLSLEKEKEITSSADDCGTEFDFQTYRIHCVELKRCFMGM